VNPGTGGVIQRRERARPNDCTLPSAASESSARWTVRWLVPSVSARAELDHDAEIALASRDLGWPAKMLDAARSILEAHGDRLNAGFARYLEVRRLLLIGHLDEAERMLADLDPSLFPPASRTFHELVVAGIAMRRLRTKEARAALARAERAAYQTGIKEVTPPIPFDHSCPRAQPMPDTLRCDSGHRPLALEHRIIGSYNDSREPSSSTCSSQHRAAVGCGSRRCLRSPRSHAHSRRAGMLPSHGPALRADRNACEPFVLPSSGSS
jgi:hypothetical protein